MAIGINFEDSLGNFDHEIAILPDYREVGKPCLSVDQPAVVRVVAFRVDFVVAQGGGLSLQWRVSLL